MTTPAPSARRQLGAELRRLREETGRTVADVAGSLGWSESKLSRIETARISIRATDLTSLLTVYAVDETALAELRRLGDQAHRDRNWWYAYGSAMPNPYEEFVAFEAQAVAMFEWEVAVVPGLLQTDEYARAVIEIGSIPRDPAVIEQRVALRMARQTALARAALTVVLDEAVLRRLIGGPDVMRRQIQRLHEISERPSITIQVLPFRAGAHPALAGSFLIFQFADGVAPVVHSEGLTGGVFRAKSAEVDAYRAAFDAVRRRALDPEATRDLLADLARELETS